MVKVAIVCGAGVVSGKEIMALELAKGLRDTGCEVEVVTSFWGDREFLGRLQDENLRAHIMRLGFISATLSLECLRMTAHQMLFWPGLSLTYKRFLSEVRPTKIVHTNWQHALLLWPFLNCERDIFWVHELVPKKPQYIRLFRALSRRLCEFVAVSQATATSLTRIGIPKHKVRVIYNGVRDSSGGSPHLTPSSFPVFGIVGQVGPWKGHEDLFQAFAEVMPSHPEAQLHIFGRGSLEYEEYLRRNAVQLGIEQNVTWHGFVKDCDKIYNRMDVIVIPSRCEESFGLTAVEASYCAIPAIASRRGGLPEIIDDGVTGCLFEAGDIRQLAQSILTLSGNVDLRKQMGEHARKRSMSLFSHDRFVQEFCEILELKYRNVATINRVE